MDDLEVSATCPACGNTNGIRAGNAMDQIFCSECGWVTDPDWDGPDTRSVLRERRRQERDDVGTDLTLDDIQDAVEEVRRNTYGWTGADLTINGDAVGPIKSFDAVLETDADVTDGWSLDDASPVEIDTVQTRAESAIDLAVQRYHEALDRHVLGAWMAGYEAVDVVTPIGQPRHAGEDAYDPAVPAIRGRVKVWESYPDDADGDDLNPYDDGQRVERYDLRDVDPDVVRRWRERDD